MWRIVALCLLWYLWSKKNYRSFDDWERALEEIKALLSILYIFGQLLLFLLIGYHDFFALFLPFSIVYFICTWDALRF